MWRHEFHGRGASQLVHSARYPPARKVIILIVEGFLIFYDAAVRKLFDMRLFLRVSRETMLRRRTERQNYVLEDGEVWEDPPFYFDEIVWPAYVEAHGRMFERGDVEHGALVKTATDDTPDGGPVKDLVLLEAESYTKEEAFVERKKRKTRPGVEPGTCASQYSERTRSPESATRSSELSGRTL